MQRVTVLGCGRSVSLSSYLRAWRMVRSMRPTDEVRGLPSDSQMIGRAGEALREFRAGLSARINRHLPWYGQGRKWSADWQGAASRTAREVNTPRLIVRWVPADLRERLAHRITGRGD